MNRIIIHIDMDAFFAAVEERENPQFRGKPLVVGADPKGGRGRGVVSTANYEARKFGIHSAMPISQAWKLCSDAIFLPVNMELYQKTSENIMRILERVVQLHSLNHKTVLMEQVSLDEAYVDVSFAETCKKAERIAQDMRAEILREEQLPCSCGIGPNKMIAKMACEAAKPDGIKVVSAEEAEAFLEPMDIQKIPGIGVKTARILRSSNLKTVEDLRKLSRHDMDDLFGARGNAMYGRVRGQDEEPVVEEREVKSIGKEVTFEEDTRDPELLIRTFEHLAAQVGREVREQGLFAKTVVVVCRLSGFETHTKSKTFLSPTQDEGILRAEAMKLFLRFIMEEQKNLRLIGVRVQIASPHRP